MDPCFIVKEDATTRDWLNAVVQFYNRLLADRDTIEKLSQNYAITKRDIKKGKSMIIAARRAYEAFINHREDIETAINKRDFAVFAILENLSEIIASDIRRMEDIGFMAKY